MIGYPTRVPDTPDVAVASAEDACAGFGVARSIEFLKQVNSGIARIGIGVGTIASAAIGGVAVILLGISGTSAVMAWLPTSTDVAGVVFARDTLPTPPARPDGPQAQISSARGEGDASDRARCPECGVVASTREIEQLGTGVDLHIAGGSTRSDRSEMPGKSTMRYEVTIRMKDGTSRVFVDANPSNWRPGERVTLIEGASLSND